MGASSGSQVLALDPRGYPPAITPVDMAPRPASLEGRTVYLVDCRFDDGDIFLQQMQAWFAEHLPAVNTVFVQKTGVYTQDDPELWTEIREKGAAAILGVGH
jgi:hypothetical protein